MEVWKFVRNGRMGWPFSATVRDRAGVVSRGRGTSGNTLACPMQVVSGGLSDTKSEEVYTAQ